MAEEYDPKTAVTVGRVIAAHGIRGEVKVEPHTDFPERFKPGARLWLAGAAMQIETARRTLNLFQIKFEGIDDRTQAEALRGKELQAPPLSSLGEGTYYHHQIIGMGVEDENGAVLGRVADVFATGSNDVYVVRGDRGDLLLPATDEVIRRIDVERGSMTVEVLEGLEWEKPRHERRKTPASR